MACGHILVKVCVGFVLLGFCFFGWFGLTLFNFILLGFILVWFGVFKLKKIVKLSLKIQAI